jgi:hypothetical protein
MWHNIRLQIIPVGLLFLTNYHIFRLMFLTRHHFEKGYVPADHKALRKCPKRWARGRWRAGPCFIRTILNLDCTN